ncbi:hypothetical protein ACO0R3_003597 [Hanseniaspora guilliermondii]
MDQIDDLNPWSETDNKKKVRSVLDDELANKANNHKSETWKTSELNESNLKSSSSVNIFEEHTSSNMKDQTVSKSDYLQAVHNNKQGDEEHVKSLDSWFSDLREEYSEYITFPVTVDIKQLDPKGVAFFKHIEYEITVNYNQCEKFVVNRRYSDFFWLMEYYNQKYPFRLLPELPPKIIPKNDAIYLKRRLEGLMMFSKLALNHPKLSKNEITSVFFQVDCEFASWRKSNNKIDFSDEFLNQKIDQHFLSNWDKKYMSLFIASVGTLDKQSNMWKNMCAHVERKFAKEKELFNEGFKLIKELEDMSLDNTIGDTFSLIEHLNFIEIHETKSYIADLKEKYKKFLDTPKTHGYFTDVHDEVISSFKVMLLTFESMKSLKERFDVLSGNNIFALNDKIEQNIQYLNTMIKSNPDSKSQEYDSIQKTIIRDKLELREQLNRQWLIKKCIMEEFLWFNEFVQYMNDSVLKCYINESASFISACSKNYNDMV